MRRKAEILDSIRIGRFSYFPCKILSKEVFLYPFLVLLAPAFTIMEKDFGLSLQTSSSTVMACGRCDGGGILISQAMSASIMEHRWSLE